MKISTLRLRHRLFSTIIHHLPTYLIIPFFCILSSIPSKVLAYNPTAAASYADTWWNSRNVPMYANYFNDCANFVSQCLIAGGISLSAGTDGTGAHVDNYGCMPFCDYLHTNLITYQSCTYSGHMTTGYPSYFTQGDVAMFGSSANSPNDPWEHATINAVYGTPALNAHTNDRYHQTVGFYYPHSNTSAGFQTGDFYHFNTSTTVMCNNDNSCSAYPLTIQASCVNSSCSTIGATNQAIPFYGGAGCATLYNSSRTDDDVWFSITPTSTSPVTIKVTPTSNLTNFDPSVGLYSGSCSSPSEITCGTSGGAGQAETIVFTPTSGTTYLIRVFSYDIGSAYSGNFNICAAQAPSAQPNLTKSTDSYTPGTNSVTINVDVQNSGAATAGASRLGYYLGVNPGSIDYLIGTDNIPSLSPAGISSQSITVNLCGIGIPDGSYYVTYYIDDLFAVNESNESDNGWYWQTPMTINCGGCGQPLNDGCNGLFDATQLTVSSSCNYISSSSCGATSSGFPSCTGNADDDVFFRFTPTSSSVTITTAAISSDYDPVFQLLTGPCGTSMQAIGSCVDNTGAGGTESSTFSGLTPGTEYFIRVWHYGTGWGSNGGNFQICVSGTCTSPPVPIITGTNSICTGASTILSVQNICGDCSYLWSDGSSGSATTVYPNSNTSYTVTATNSCGEMATSEGYAVTVNPLPDQPVISGTNSVCSGDPATLSVQNTCGDCSYLWSDGSSGSANTVYPNSNTSYTVTATNLCGEMATSESYPVTVNPLPDQPVISGTNSVCSGDPATLSVQNTCGDCSYLWSDGSSGSTTTVYPNSNTSYTVTATNSCGQMATSEGYQVTVNPLPDQPVISGTNSVCSGNPVTLSVQNPCSDCSYLWSDGSSGSTTTVYPNSNTSYNVTVTSPCGQTVTSEGYQVAVSTSTDQPIITGNNQINLGESTTLSISNPCSDGCTYTWSTGSTNSSIIVSPNTTTNYTVTAHNSCGETASLPYTVTVVLTQPSITAFSPTSGAAGTTVNITGINFTPGIKVTFGGTQAASVNFISSTNLSAVVGNGSTGYVLIETASGSDSLAKFTYSCDSINNPAPTIVSFGDTILTSTTANYYQWYFNNNILTGEKLKSLYIDKVGFYRVETSPNNECWVSSFDYPVIVTPSQLTDSLKMFVYPNPTSTGTFNVDVKLPQTTGVITYVAVYDINGNVIKQTDRLIFFGNEIRIPVILNNVANGDYIVKVFINKDQRQRTITIAK